LVVVIIGDHLLRLALETHTLVATTASNTVTTVNSYHWNLTGLVGALPYSIILHVSLKELVGVIFSLLASDQRMVPHLNKALFTLQPEQ
jgi:hypothetical protein